MESGKQRLDCACAVGLGFGPLVFTLWASLGALRFFNVFWTPFGVTPGPQKRNDFFLGLYLLLPLLLFLTAATKGNITRRLYEQLVWGCGDASP